MDNININPKEMEWVDMASIDVASDKDQRRAPLIALMKLRIPYEGGEVVE
jgi:hypothetical protein